MSRSLTSHKTKHKVGISLCSSYIDGPGSESQEWKYHHTRPLRDFPSSPVAKTPHSQCKEPRFPARKALVFKRRWGVGCNLSTYSTKGVCSHFKRDWKSFKKASQKKVRIEARNMSLGQTVLWWSFQCNSVGKESACNEGDTGDVGSIPGSGISPGGGNSNPFQYSCLGNPMDRGAWWATKGGKELDMTEEQLSTSLKIKWKSTQKRGGSTW